MGNIVDEYLEALHSKKETKCKVKSAFAVYLNNVTETAKRCYIDASRIEFKRPKCYCKKCLKKMEKVK